MSTAAQQTSAELSRLQELGRELGASFLPPTDRQGAAVRTILVASIDMWLIAVEGVVGV